MRRRLPLLILPLLLLLTWRLLLSEKAPYYHGSHSDPEYAYLLNALAILDGGTPGHFDHPGTPVQLIGAGVILALHGFVSLFSPWEPVTVSVLRDPESYLLGINLCLGLLSLLGVFVLSIRIATMAGTAAALVFQLSLFAFFQIPLAMTRVSAEALLVTATLVVATIAMPLLLGRPERSYGLSIALGLAFGFGIATKVTFLPICLLVFLLEGARARILCVASTLAGFVVSTVPIWANYRAFLDWLLKLVTHDGRYGTGARGLPSGSALVQNGLDLLKAEPFLVVNFGLVALAALLAGLRRPAARPFVIGCAVLAVQWLITTQQYPSPHYLLPSLAFGSVLIGVAYATHPEIRGRATLAGFILIVSVGVLETAWHAKKWIAAERAATANLVVIEDTLAQTPCAVISSYGSSQRSYALGFGNHYVNGRFSAPLHELYPRDLVFNIWSGSFHSFRAPVSAQQIRLGLSSRCYLMDGNQPDAQQGKYWEESARRGLARNGLAIERSVTAGDQVLWALKARTVP